MIRKPKSGGVELGGGHPSGAELLKTGDDFPSFWVSSPWYGAKKEMSACFFLFSQQQVGNDYFQFGTIGFKGEDLNLSYWWF